MGKKPAQIEEDIRAQRERISLRVQSIEQRAQDDVAALRSETRARARDAAGDAAARFQDARGSLNKDSLKTLMEEHPASTMAGAVGIGVLLGMVSDGSGGRNGGTNGYAPQQASGQFEGAAFGSNGGGPLGGLLASVLGPAASTAQEELQQLVRDGFSIFKGQPPAAPGEANRFTAGSPDARVH